VVRNQTCTLFCATGVLVMVRRKMEGREGCSFFSFLPLLLRSWKVEEGKGGGMVHELLFIVRTCRGRKGKVLPFLLR